MLIRTLILKIGLTCLSIVLVKLAVAADVLIPTEQLKTATGKRYYLISIGIDQYADKFWPNLKWPSRDALKVSDQFGLQTDSQVVNITILNRNANLKNVRNILADVKSKTTAVDTVILYLSGHGSLALNQSGVLEQVAVMQDSDSHNLYSTGLKHSELRLWLESLASRKKLMVMATCHSGVGKSRLPQEVESLLSRSKGTVVPLADVSEGSLILAAAARGESALEDDKLEGDVYTYFLLEALSFYDRNRDGMVSALEAHDYAKEKTWNFSQGKQRPTADIRLIGDADIALAGRKINPAVPILEAYDESLAGYELQVDRQKGKLPHAFALSPNGSQVKLFAPGGDQLIGKYFVNLPLGQNIDLKRVISHRPIIISTNLTRYTWQQKAWGSMAGSDNLLKADMQFGYRWNKIFVGARMHKKASIKRNWQTNLDLSTQYESLYYSAGWIQRYKHWLFFWNLQYGKESIQIALQDTVNQDKLVFKDSKNAIGIYAVISKPIYADFHWNLQFGRIWNRWNLGALGRFSADKDFISTGVSYHFGIRARTL